MHVCRALVCRAPAAIGGSGSAYGYAYAGFGELAAWLIGWDLILEYTVAVAAVAVGWSCYLNDTLAAAGVGLPAALRHGPHGGGLLDLGAVLVIALLGGLLAVGVRASARFNAATVLVKVTAIAVFIAAAIGHVNPVNWSEFTPFGWGGVMATWRRRSPRRIHRFAVWMALGLIVYFAYARSHSRLAAGVDAARGAR